MTWAAVSLGEVAEITMGQAPRGDSYNDQGQGVPLLAGPGDFTRGQPQAKKCTTRPTKICRPGDVILGIRASIGEKVIADRPYCLGRGVAGLRADDARLDQGFLWHWLSHSSAALAAKGRGATFLQVSRTDIGELPMLLPPLDEQRRIAAILDHVAWLRSQCSRSIEILLDLVKQGFLSEFTEGRGWPVSTIGELATKKGAIRTGPFGSQLLHSEFVDEGVAVLGIDNAVSNEFRWVQRRFITEKKYEQLKRYTVHPGDVLITLMGTCGRSAVVPEDVPLAINTKHLCCITPDSDKSLPDFLHASFLWQPLTQAHLERSTKGGIMDGLNMGIIKDAPVILPPLEEQHRIVQLMARVRASLAQARASLDAIDNLGQSLQGRAFSGGI